MAARCIQPPSSLLFMCRLLQMARGTWRLTLAAGPAGWAAAGAGGSTLTCNCLHSPLYDPLPVHFYVLPVPSVAYTAPKSQRVANPPVEEASHGGTARAVQPSQPGLAVEPFWRSDAMGTRRFAPLVLVLLAIASIAGGHAGPTLLVQMLPGGLSHLMQV